MTIPAWLGGQGERSFPGSRPSDVPHPGASHHTSLKHLGTGTDFEPPILVKLPHRTLSRTALNPYTQPGFIFRRQTSGAGDEMTAKVQSAH